MKKAKKLTIEVVNEEVADVWLGGLELLHPSIHKALAKHGINYVGDLAGHDWIQIQQIVESYGYRFPNREPVVCQENGEWLHISFEETGEAALWYIARAVALKIGQMILRRRDPFGFYSRGK